MKAHRLATFALALTATTALPAQTIDFLTSNGGFTAQSLIGSNAWSWAAGTGWAVNSRSQIAHQRLLSPVLTALGGTYSISATHRYNFEGSMNTTTCWDGGVVLASINGGAFAALMPSSGKGYDGVISSSTNLGNPLGGSQAFCRAQTSNVISTWTGTLAAGTTIQS
ncbi:MAG: hypothetical protein MUF40_05085 [Gemmatimonadaceae bacterium]|nr:hypothetical protein [Gemmatimonadaceae bacterium]